MSISTEFSVDGRGSRQQGSRQQTQAKKIMVFFSRQQNSTTAALLWLFVLGVIALVLIIGRRNGRSEFSSRCHIPWSHSHPTEVGCVRGVDGGKFWQGGRL